MLLWCTRSLKANPSAWSLLALLNLVDTAHQRQRAARIRRHALALRFDESAPRLLALARELDARADAMESSAD
jgi:hypothetical protein